MSPPLLEVSGLATGVSTLDAQMRWRPVRNSRTGSRRWPFASVVSAGMPANASVEPSATPSG